MESDALRSQLGCFQDGRALQGGKRLATNEREESENLADDSSELDERPEAKKRKNSES